ncbi:MAG TPA: response regulator [Vicinamibacterales bacterium]|nr:response regulator [Vicinamibacterales bacterium]
MRRRLLLADDSVTIQRVIELTFADEDIDVIAVGDGESALARLASDPPDIILADVGMPGKDGYDIALHVRRTPSLSHIPVVLLIGALQPLDQARAAEAGCAAVLVKPFEPSQVIEKVRELLDRASAGKSAGAGAFDIVGAGVSAPTDARTPSPADALLQAPPAAGADDYFARLDAAFAQLDAAPEPAVDAPAADTPAADTPAGPDVTAAARGLEPAAAPEAGATVAPEPEPAAPPAVEEPTPGQPVAAFDVTAPGPAPGHHGAPLADAFAAVLALEQGQSPSRLPADWPSPLVDVVEPIAERVAEQVAERVVRAVAPEIVSRVSERLVREEIERLRRELASS